MKNVTPRPPRPRGWLLAAGLALGVLLFVLFPRFATFAEIAAREVRVLWWMIALIAIGCWLTFIVGKERK